MERSRPLENKKNPYFLYTSTENKKRSNGIYKIIGINPVRNDQRL